MITVQIMRLYPADVSERGKYTMTLDVKERTRACDVEIGCPDCGRPQRLESYKIEANGIVVPTFECKAACGFKGILLLMGWS